VFSLVVLPPAPSRAAGPAPARHGPGRPVPVRLLAERLGLRSEFNPVSAVIELDRGGKTAHVAPGTGAVYLGQRVVFLREQVVSYGADVLLPADAVDLLIGYFQGKPFRWSYEREVFSVQTAPAPLPRPGGQAQPGPKPTGGSRQYDVRAVVIDAGHGGKDPGGVGHGGVKEKDIVLDVALELQRELRKRLGEREIVVTRDRDVFLTLEERSEIANKLEPEKNPIFVSVHANVSLDVKADGFESYFLSLDSYDETAREVASMENSVLSYEMENYGSHLKDIINRIVDIEYRRESYLLAGKIQNGLSVSAGREQDRGVKSAFFYVLKAVKMPSVLVEIGFVTNRDEVKKMLTPDYRKKVARGIAEGIADFVDTFVRTEGFTKQGT
jgi:N-acetylmuramoyl-L-alanine amidase